MKIKVNEFKTLIRKATLNFTIPTVQFIITTDRIKSSLKDSSCISILDTPNNVFEILEEESYTFNFKEPHRQVMPLFNLIEDDEADLDIRREKIIVKSGNQRADIHFCASTIVHVFNGTPRGLEAKHSIEINEEFFNIFDKIKKVGAVFGKIYIVVSSSNLYIETTDREQRFSNGLSFLLDRNLSVSDFSLCFDFQHVNSLFSVIDRSSDIPYICKFMVSGENLGALNVSNHDGSELFFILSKKI